MSQCQYLLFIGWRWVVTARRMCLKSPQKGWPWSEVWAQFATHWSPSALNKNTIHKVKGERKLVWHEISLCRYSERDTIRVSSPFNSTLKGMSPQNFWCWGQDWKKAFSICSCGSLSVCVCVCVCTLVCWAEKEERDTHRQRSERVERCNFLIWCLRASGVTNKNVFMQRVRVSLTFSIFPLSSLSPPFTLFLIIYSFWGKKREK